MDSDIILYSSKTYLMRALNNTFLPSKLSSVTCMVAIDQA